MGGQQGQAAPPNSWQPQAGVPPPYQPAGPPAPQPKDASAIGCMKRMIAATSGADLKTRLDWQAGLAGDKARCEDFRDDVLGMTELCVFGWMKEGSAVINLLHSTARFPGLGSAPELRGQVVGFVGDRDVFGNQPHPVKLQKRNAWEWMAFDHALEYTAMITFFANTANRDVGWAPDAAQAKTQGRIPRLIYLPYGLALYCMEAQRTPYELLKYIGEEIAKPGCGLTAQDFKLVQDWGVLASQRSGQGNSLLCLKMEPVTSADPVLGQWIQARLNGTLGIERAAQAPAPAQQPVIIQQAQQGQDIAQMLAAVGTRMGVTLAESLKPMTLATTNAMLEKRRAATEGKQYTGADLAKIKSWSNVHSVRDIQPVWREFQTTKNIDTHREALWKGMELWSSTYGYEIDKSIYYGKSTMEDIVDLKMIPAGHLPDLSTAEKGNSFLASVFRSVGDTKTAMESDEAEGRSSDNVTYAERLRLLASEGRPPPNNFLKFKRAVATYAAKQWTLFGDHCPFYKGLVDIRNTMELGSCQAQQESYKPLLCRQYSWAIMVDCQTFFMQTVSKDEFTRAMRSGSNINFPVSDLSSIVNNVLHGTHVFRLSFPKAWLSQQDRIDNGSEERGGWTPPDTSRRNGNRGNGGRNGRNGGSNNRDQGNGGGSNSNSNQGNGGGSNSNSYQRRNDNGTAGGNGQDGWSRGGGNNGNHQQQGQNNQQDGSRDNLGHMHPAIKRMMDPYLQKFNGRVQFLEILDAAGVRLNQLPTIRGQMDGNRSLVCWQGLLGKCPHQSRGNCHFNHIPRYDVPNDFAAEACRLLQPGVDYLVRNGRPPPGRDGEQNRQGNGRNVRGRQ